MICPCDKSKVSCHFWGNANAEPEKNAMLNTKSRIFDFMGSPKREFLILSAAEQLGCQYK